MRNLRMRCSHHEVLLYSMLFTSFGSICIITLSGELRVAVEFVSAQPDILILVPLYSLSGYMSMACILAMVRLFGATDTEIVKSLRKVCRRVASACGRTCLVQHPFIRPHPAPSDALSYSLLYLLWEAGEDYARFRNCSRYSRAVRECVL